LKIICNNVKKYYLIALGILLTCVSCLKDDGNTESAMPPEAMLSVATLNVDGLPEKVLFINVNPDGPGDFHSPAIGAYLTTLDCDFVGLQENFNFSKSIFAVTDPLYAHDEWQGGIFADAQFDLSNFRFETDGLNGLWNKNRVTLEDERVVPWSVAYGKVDHASDDLVTKGFRRYELLLKGGLRVVVYNMHMDASDDEDELTGADAPDREARIQQWKELADDILKRLDNRPIVVMGDMNSLYWRDNVQAVFFNRIQDDARALAHDVYVEMECGGVFPKTLDKEETLDKIIYINPVDGFQLEPFAFYKDTENYVGEDGRTPLGDHYPIMAKFRVR